MTGTCASCGCDHLEPCETGHVRRPGRLPKDPAAALAERSRRVTAVSQTCTMHLTDTVCSRCTNARLAAERAARNLEITPGQWGELNRILARHGDATWWRGPYATIIVKIPWRPRTIRIPHP